jgi:DNA-binding response OmpR family regulator
MESIRILVAEDDPKILTGLVDMLESEGYRAVPAIDGEQALKLFESKKFDLVLLDIMMPGKSGYDVCRTIRSQDERVPIIMLTAKGQEIDKVVGLQLGADDYVTKPFGVNELLARIAAVLRRSRQSARQASDEEVFADHFDFGDTEIDGLQYKVKKGRQTLDLSGRELRLLQFFHAHPNEVLSRDMLLNAVWGMNYFGTTRTVDQHIAQLRKKIEADPNNPRVITTVHGVGYRYETF